VGVTCQSTVHTTVGVTEQLESGSRRHLRSTRLNELRRIGVDRLELNQERIGAVPLRFLGSHVGLRHLLSGRSLRDSSLFALKKPGIMTWYRTVAWSVSEMTVKELMLN
jgi:hypothetical protein